MKNVGGPVKLLYIIMFDILKGCQKCIFGPVKGKQFYRCVITFVSRQQHPAKTIEVNTDMAWNWGITVANSMMAIKHKSYQQIYMSEGYYYPTTYGLYIHLSE